MNTTITTPRFLQLDRLVLDSFETTRHTFHGDESGAFYLINMHNHIFIIWESYSGSEVVVTDFKSYDHAAKTWKTITRRSL